METEGALKIKIKKHNNNPILLTRKNIIRCNGAVTRTVLFTQILQLSWEWMVPSFVFSASLPLHPSLTSEDAGTGR